MDDALARGLAQLLAGVDSPSAEEIADALWMARVIGRDTAREAAGEPGPEQGALSGHEAEALAPFDDAAGEPYAEGARSTDRRPPRPPTPVDARRGRTGSDGRPSVAPPRVPLHPVSTGTAGRPSSRSGSTGAGRIGAGAPGTVVRAPREPALNDSLAISRALRPLKRRVAASGARTLDEEATATASGETSLLMPAWLPRTERWLSADLIVDTGPSMVMWHQLAAELRTLLEGQGAFRTVRAWSLESGGTEPRLSVFRRATGTRPKRVMPWEHLADPAGRHLLLILTDGVGPLWRRGGMEAALRQWSRDRPVAVLQVLPRSLWHRTGLAPVPVAARPAPQGRTTPLFRGENAVRGMPPTVRRGGWVPVLELDAEWIAPWAQVVSGRASGWTPLLALPTDEPGEDSRPLPDAYDAAPGGPQAPDLVERFRGEASQSAFELAGYLAAAPLVMPVMRLVQRVMLPRSKPSHLAEVFLSGLLSRADDGAPALGEDPDLTLYDFRPGVRDALLATLTRQESLRTLDVVGRVSGRVAQQLGGSLDFRALIPSAGPRGVWRLPEESLPFARVAADVLAGLGGGYRATAAALTEQIDAVSSRTGSLPADPLRTGGKHRPARPSTPGRIRHTPMLFVGLGGTGGQIGAQLEHRLRSELCGPDGTALQHIGGLAPHQLPGNLQFVYADFSEAELQELPQFAADPALRAVYSRTSRVTPDLRPDFDSSLEVTRMLRTSLGDEVGDWLPPQTGEPRVTPLHDGALRLPTVGRAALFATLRHSLQPVLEPLLEAIDAIVESADELGEPGVRRPLKCDVFVAFSVAGGTGAGIFLDYLHLISHAFTMRRFNGVKIYPLVVMPSSPRASIGGGREAELNAASSLIDLFRLVDSQNAPTVGDDTSDLGREAGLGIRYPYTTPVRLRAGILPTAFLFSPTPGIRQDGLHGSVVSLMMSLIGTEQSDADSQNRTMASGGSPGFTERFINRGLQRGALSPAGIGRQGVSTGLVTSMTTPRKELADLMAGRLLAAATTELVRPTRYAVKSGATALMRQLFVDSHLETLWDRPELPFSDTSASPRGRDEIEEALNHRLGEMRRRLSELQEVARLQTASMAGRFSPRPAIDALLRSVDPFLAERLVQGGRGSGQPISRSGFMGMLAARAKSPERPPGVGVLPPGIPFIRDRLGGLSPARWDDDDVRAARQAQDNWYHWRSLDVWHEAWREQRQRWQPQAHAACDELSQLVSALLEQAGEQRRGTEEKIMRLYEQRDDISYLLPPQRTLDDLYKDVVNRLIREEGLHEEDEAALLLRMVDGSTWRSALTHSSEDPAGAVAAIQALLAARVMGVFTGDQLDTVPLLPSVGLLLSAATGDPDTAGLVSEQALDLFGRRLGGLLPSGFTPEGTGPLWVLITHPRGPATEGVQEYLGRALRLPSEDRTTVEYREAESDSITVVLIRTEMGLTQVPEAHKVLRKWAKAKNDEQPQDMLRWRQRLSFEDDWLVSSEEDRRTLLHHLLCCLWNGQVDVVEGNPFSPASVKLRLFNEAGPEAPGVQLRLKGYPDSLSSWPDVLRAYEHWTVLDDRRTVEDYCSLLLSAEPLGLTRAVTAPHPMFVELVEHIAPRQLRLLRNLRHHTDGRERTRIRPLWEFWARTLPAALDVEFRDPQAVRPTLRELSQWAQAHPDRRG
ncbi:SAV_2336 N-terminal domain-related protein [Streptomyces cyaneofuscatus]|uniref:SAV_2336 N-terminal domain-related protein n=1 Tax=Streptomyces cyaneofuscatus TaxID=66883 RepID=UPI0037D77C06